MKPPFKIDPIPSLLPTGGLQYLKNLFFPKRNQLAAVNRQLEVDIHAHWLPGVDDGAQTEEEGLSLVRGLVELGYSKLVATPHIKADHYNNDPIKLGKVFSKFKKAVKAAGINVELGLAAEYMLDDGFIKHLEDALLRIRNKTYGICRVTGKLISKERLRLVPHATLSIEAKQQMNG